MCLLFTSKKKIKARQRGRELSSELTHIGAALYDLLGKESENQEKRNHQAGRQLESSNAEPILHNVVATANAKLTADRAQLDAALMERQAISSKIERKKADLERLKQRLDTLQKIRFEYFFFLFSVYYQKLQEIQIYLFMNWNRPAFSEEFEKAEEELQKLYGEYLTHVRCLDALRAQMNVNAKIAQPASEDGRKTSAPASMILLPDGILDLSDELSNDGDDLLEEDANELKLKRSSEANADGSDSKADKPVDGQTSRAKLRIKTGGKFFKKKCRNMFWFSELSLQNFSS